MSLIVSLTTMTSHDAATGHLRGRAPATISSRLADRHDAAAADARQAISRLTPSTGATSISISAGADAASPRRAAGQAFSARMGADDYSSFRDCVHSPRMAARQQANLLTGCISKRDCSGDSRRRLMMRGAALG